MYWLSCTIICVKAGDVLSLPHMDHNMESNNLRTISFWRGIVALLYMNLLWGAPTIFFMYGIEISFEKNPYFYFGFRIFAILASVGGLFIAFHRDWLNPSFWVPDNFFWEKFKPRLWTLLPFLLVGVVAGIFSNKLIAIWALEPKALIEFMVTSIASTLALIILFAMFWKRLGWLKTAFLIAILNSLLTILTFLVMAYRHLLAPDYPYFTEFFRLVAQIVFILGLVKLLKNSHWNVILVWAYTFAYIFMADVFNIGSLNNGSLIQQITMLTVGVALVWNERSLCDSSPSVN